MKKIAKEITEIAKLVSSAYSEKDTRTPEEKEVSKKYYDTNTENGEILDQYSELLNKHAQAFYNTGFGAVACKLKQIYTIIHNSKAL